MAENVPQPLWWIQVSSAGEHPSRVAYDCMRAMAPYFHRMRGDEIASSRHFGYGLLDRLLSEASRFDKWCEERFAPQHVNQVNLGVRRNAGEPARPRVRLSARVTSRGNLVVEVLPSVDPRTGEPDLMEPAIYAMFKGWQHRPWFDAMFLRDTERYFDPFEDGDERHPHHCARATLGIFVLRAFEYAASILRRHTDVEIANAVEIDPESGALPYLRISTPEEREAEKQVRLEAERMEAEERRRREQERQLEADVAWIRELPQDALRIEATIAAAEACGAMKKDQITFLKELGIHATYENLGSTVARLRGALDAGVPGWRDRKAKPLRLFEAATREPPSTAEVAGRPSFDATVALINKHRVETGLEPVPAGRIPRTEQHLRRFAKTSGYTPPGQK